MTALHLFVVPYWTIVVMKLGVAGLAFWRGDWRARSIISIELASLAYHLLRPTNWRPTWPVAHLQQELIIDSALLAVCLACALSGRRYWTIAAASIALAGWLTDVVSLFGGVSIWSYLSAWVIWVWLLMATILWGVWTTHRDRVSSAGPAPQAP